MSGLFFLSLSLLIYETALLGFNMANIPGFEDSLDAWWDPVTDPNDAMSASQRGNLKQRCRAYAERAAEVASSGLFVQNTSKPTRHPWNHQFHGNCNVTTLEFQGDHRDTQHQDGAELRDFLMEWARLPDDESLRPAGNTAATMTCNRRIILVEDLHPRAAEQLGVQLDIPPEFFLAHCDKFINLSVVDGACAGQGDRYWRVSIPQIRSVSQVQARSSTKSPVWCVESGSFDREFMQLSDEITSVGFFSQVSYWNTRFQDDSWIVVVLMDPQTSQLRNQEQPYLSLSLEPFYYPRQLCTEVFPSANAPSFKRPEVRPLYEALTQAYDAKHDNKYHTADPFSATLHVRSFVRAAWDAHIIRLAATIQDELFDDSVEHKGYSGTDALNTVNARENKSGKRYQELYETLKNLKNVQAQVRHIMHAFEFENPKHTLRTKTPGNETAKATHAATVTSSQERKMWDLSVSKLTAMEDSVRQLMDVQAQRAAMESSYASIRQAADANKMAKSSGELNEHAVRQSEDAYRQARSAGQLTKIATVIVPCTFIASIFSMGGAFAAGERLFYVFWAVSLPITFSLLTWVLYGEPLEKWWKKTKPGRQVAVTKENLRKRIAAFGNQFIVPDVEGKEDTGRDLERNAVKTD